MKYYVVRVTDSKKSIPLPYEVNEHFVYTCNNSLFIKVSIKKRNEI